MLFTCCLLDTAVQTAYVRKYLNGVGFKMNITLF